MGISIFLGQNCTEDNLLNPNSDENESSLYITTAFSNIQMMRIKETITKDKMS